MSAAKNSVHPLVRFAHVGSTIETVFSDGRRTRVTVNTPMACAEANSLIMSGRWHVVDKPNAGSDASASSPIASTGLVGGEG